MDLKKKMAYISFFFIILFFIYLYCGRFGGSSTIFFYFKKIDIKGIYQHFVDKTFYYIRAFGKLMGINAWLLLTCVPLIFFRFKAFIVESKIALAWFFGNFLFILIIFPFDERHIFPLLPLGYFLIASVLFPDRSYFRNKHFNFKNAGIINLLILVVLLGSNCLGLVRHPFSPISGYDIAANYVYRNADNNIVLCALRADGNFIFHMKRFDRERKFYILRASKQIYSTNVQSTVGYKRYMFDEKEILKFLYDNSIKTIVVETYDELLKTPDGRVENPIDPLKKVIKNQPHFILVKEFDVKGERGNRIQIYKYTGPIANRNFILKTDIMIIKNRLTNLVSVKPNI